MRHYLTLLLFVTIVLSSCQSKLTNKFKGRIYILESQEIFFQLNENGVANYYWINTMGEKYISIHDASWSILKDTTLILTVKYEPKYENAEFILKYNIEKDYWRDEDFISVFRRKKQVKFQDVELNEF